jgi:hypothetical protein
VSRIIANCIWVAAIAAAAHWAGTHPDLIGNWLGAVLLAYGDHIMKAL